MLKVTLCVVHRMYAFVYLRLICVYAIIALGNGHISSEIGELFPPLTDRDRMFFEYGVWIFRPASVFWIGRLFVY